MSPVIAMTKRGFAAGLTAVAAFLLLLNVYGLTLSLRPKGIETEHLRFGVKDHPLSEVVFNQAVRRRPGEPADLYARRLTGVVADGLAHIHWERYPVDQFNQRVPLWENYFLWLMSVFTDIPEYDRYHFSNPEKSMERGIGICGDASILMSQMLEREGIDSRLITIPGHVVVEALIEGRWQVYDPDFGVVIPYSGDALAAHAEAVASLYADAGYRPYEVAFIRDRMAREPTYWDGVEHFITRKHYFEYVSYAAKWLLPLLLLALGTALLRPKG